MIVHILVDIQSQNKQWKHDQQQFNEAIAVIGFSNGYNLRNLS